MAMPLTHLPEVGEVVPAVGITDGGFTDIAEHPLPGEGGVFLSGEGLSLDKLYAPVPGRLIPEKTKEIPNGTLYIGTYETARATHRTGIYVPDGYEPTSDVPIVAMTTALGTGVKGHNQAVAEEIMQTGCVVAVKGPPRYAGPTLRALTLAQDANEMHGVLNEAEASGIIGDTTEPLIYGESQAGMKGLGFTAVAGHYGRQVLDGQVVAPCYLRRADFANPLRIVTTLAAMARSGLRTAQTMSPEESSRQRGTWSWKDAHHHAIVLPVLLSGETGSFLPHIDPDQELTVDFFGKDKSSQAHRAAGHVQANFPNMQVSLDETYGHIDGIMSPPVAARRQERFSAAAQKRGAAPTATIVSLYPQ